MFNDIVVPLDGSPKAARALGPACAIAHYLDSAVRTVAFATEDNEDDLRTTIEAQLGSYGGVKRSVAIEPVRTSIAEQIAGTVADSPGSLLCMSTTGRGRSAAVLGSVASRVLERVTSPAILVGPGYDAKSFRCRGPLLVAVDTDDHSQAILPIAESFAIVFDYELEVVTVNNPRYPVAAKPGDGPDSSREVTLESSGPRAIALAIEQDIDSPVTYTVLHHTDPAAALVERAEKTDAALLAMSTHNPIGLRRALGGSTTSRTVHRAPCPVLTVRPPVPAVH